MTSVQLGIREKFDVLIDEDDLPKVLKYRWTHLKKTRDGSGDVYFRAYVQGKTVYLHRFLTGASSSFVVDHANRNTLDNRKSNLRIATKSQNSANSKRFDKTYRGVIAGKGIWKACAAKGKISITVSGLESEREAAKWHNTVAQLLHGDFAYRNKVGRQ